MGWLRDYMTAARPSIPSFGRLAVLCLDHEAWPSDLRPKERSLSTLFSKLDRGKDLDWLRDRIEVQQVLAHLFNRPLGDLRTALGETPTEGGHRFVRLVDVRYAREIDLSTEELPPGIPLEAHTPQFWEPTWWVAPAGSGRSLVAGWLEARGLAHAATIRHRDDLARVPARGPLFLEVDSTVSEEKIALTEADLLNLRTAHRPICIAAPFPSPFSSFTPLHSAPPVEYLPELVDWIEERLDGTGHFHADRVENWMRKVAIPAGAVQSFGDALGLLGMADETHPRSLLAKSLDELAEYFVRRRVREASEQMTVGPRLAETAFPALQECAARVLVSGKNTLLSSHPLDEWTALLSTPDEGDAPDPEWFTTALKGALGAQISRRDLKRAAKKLPPSAFQLSKSLEAAGLLVRDPRTTVRDEFGAERHLHPRWLVSLLTSRATQEALRLAPSQWGRVLLAGLSADAIVQSLLESAKRDDYGACFSLVDDYDATRPELIAALEGAIIAVGLATLEGDEPPEELVEGLLQFAAEDVMLFDKCPEPRLVGGSCRLFARDVFLVALGALCRLAPFPLAHLDPLRTDHDNVRLHFSDAAKRVLRQTGDTSRGTGILILLDAIFAGNSSERAACLRLADRIQDHPDELLDEALGEVKLETLLRFVDASERSSTAFTRGMWQLLESHPDPTGLFSDPDSAREFWRKASGRVLVKRAQNDLVVEWTSLLPHQFSEWFAQAEAPPLPEEAGPHCPVDAALAFAEESSVLELPSATLKILLARGAARFGTLLYMYLSKGQAEEAAHLFGSVPREASASIARTLPPASELLEYKAPVVDTVRTFLLRACHERQPEFEECYTRLVALEKGLQPLRKLS